MTTPPKIDNAPGLTWKPRKAGWEARWQCRTDLARRGFLPKSYRIWTGTEPTAIDIAYIIDRCNSFQTEMLVWGRGGIPVVSAFDSSVNGLIDSYETDVDSPFRKLRYHTRRFYMSLCKRLRSDLGADQIADLKARQLLHYHEEFVAAGKIPMGHSIVGMLRILSGFGATILEDDECARLSGVLSKMRFKMPKSRNERVTAEQATEIRSMAHALGRPSIALAQALQFELMLRQKDIIGEWVPINEPGMSGVHDGNSKWLRGLRWEEVDSKLILTHMTSKRQKEITVDLKIAEMVMTELSLKYGHNVTRDRLPASGAIIISESSGVPWHGVEFRRNWRLAADKAGVPKAVKNMDSRAGAISEATDAGADLEHVRQAATHSDISMTQKYSRNDVEKTAGVMRTRAEFRKNKA